MLFSVNDDTEMLSPGWTEVYINALQVSHLFYIYCNFIVNCYLTCYSNY